MPSPGLTSLPLWSEALLVPGLLAAMAWMRGTVSRSGALGGFVLAALLYLILGWRGMLAPLVFFVLGVSATRYGFAQKAAKGIAQEEEGRRGAKHALANVSAGLLFAMGWSLTGWTPLLAAFTASYATAAADTVSSEIGQVLGKTPIHPLTGRRMQPGEEGAVSLEGTLAGAFGALLVALTLLATGWEGRLAVVGIVALAGVLGNWLESLLGSLTRGALNNELMNFLNTVLGGAIAWGLVSLWR